MTENGVFDDLNKVDKLVLTLIRSKRKEPIPQRLWLQKELFQMSKNLPNLAEYLSYNAHYQGPFSENVEAVENKLRSYGLVKKGKDGSIQLTDRGEEISEDASQDVPPEVRELVEDVKRFMNDMSKQEILAYVYYTYPDMTDKSVEKEELDQNRVEIAKRLYNRGKVSKEKAAEIAGMSLSEFWGIVDEEADS